MKCKCLNWRAWQWRMKVALVQTFFLLTQCTSLTSGDLLGQEEYSESRFWFSDYEYERALQDFPEGENGGFLTTTEKGYISLLAGKPQIEPMRAVADSLESRRMVKATTEAASFLYKETEDRYFPAEHEAILLHVITGLSYAAKGMRQEARIEAKRAAIYLEQQFGRDNQFDDPFLRILIAGLFIYAGDWDEAKVDFRAAAPLLPEWAELEKLADENLPPKDLVIVFSGNGAEAANAIGDLGVEIKAPQQAPAKIYFDGKEAQKVVHTHNLWYKRHLVRDRTVKHILDQTKRSIDSFSSHSIAGAIAASGFATGVTLGVVGVASGLYVLYLGSGAEGAGYLGIILAGSGLYAGSAVIDYTNGISNDILERGDDRARYYRFLRFLPQASQFAVSDRASQVVVKSPTGREVKPFLTLGEASGPRIRYYHVSSASGAQLEAKELPLYWQLGEQYWFLGAEQMVSFSGGNICRDLKLGKNLKPGLPDRDMFQYALHHGIATSSTNSIFARELNLTKWFWCKTDNDCHRCSTDGAYEKIDCSAVSGVLCVLQPQEMW